MGAVNAVASLAACLPAVIWGLPPAQPAVVAFHRVVVDRLRARRGLVGGCVGLAGRISPPFLDFIESSGVTTSGPR